MTTRSGCDTVSTYLLFDFCFCKATVTVRSSTGKYEISNVSTCPITTCRLEGFIFHSQCRRVGDLHC